jgi:DNA-directed RNA polymerase specialized sigma24 family protein
MPRNKFSPDYAKMYPDTHISAEVMAVLKKGDRKEEYQQYDLKSESWKIDQDAQTAKCIPSREDSLDRLLEEDKQFAHGGESVEDATIKKMMLDKLPSCLDRLDGDERALIDALFFGNGGAGMTEREYAELHNVPCSTIHSRKKNILATLHKLMKN